jgi:hypothetical protein
MINVDRALRARLTNIQNKKEVVIAPGGRARIPIELAIWSAL